MKKWADKNAKNTKSTCSANQLTGFCMIGTLVVKGLAKDTRLNQVRIRFRVLKNDPSHTLKWIL